MVKYRIEGMIIAFSMYSKIPMPQVQWNEKNRSLAMAFFPLVGLALAFFMLLMYCILDMLNIGLPLRAAVFTLLPILLTGGIHMDGFLDTVDALSSWQTREKRLEILKDPRCGSFAVIGGVSFVLMTYALWVEILGRSFDLLPIVPMFIVSRALTVLLLLWVPKAKADGLATEFSKGRKQKEVVFLTMFWGLLGMVGFGFGGLYYLFLYLVVQSAFLLLYIKRINKEFGGITGDLCGFYLQNNEMLCLIIFLIGRLWFT